MADQKQKLASTSKRFTHRESRTRQSLNGDRNIPEVARQVASALARGARDRNMAEQKQKLASTSTRLTHRELTARLPTQNFVGHQLMAYPNLPPVKNIVLVGRAGNGKSATANSLLGKQVFFSEERLTGVTRRCQTYERTSRSGSTIKVIDTPGLYDGSVSNGSISREIINFLKLVDGGLHVVVLVLSVRTRFTIEEENTLRDLYVLFGDEIVNYLIVLFTGGDKLEAKDETLGDHLRKGCPKTLKTVLSMCDHRRVMFNNRTSNEGKKMKQLQHFFALVAEIEKRTHGKPFRGQIQRNLKKETDRRRQEQKAIEARKLGEREFAEKTQQLEMWYANKMTNLENEVKNRLKEISKLKEDLEKAERENINMQDKQMISSMINLGIKASPMLGAAAPVLMGSCSIL